MKLVEVRELLSLEKSRILAFVTFGSASSHPEMCCFDWNTDLQMTRDFKYDSSNILQVAPF